MVIFKSLDTHYTIEEILEIFTSLEYRGYRHLKLSLALIELKFPW